MPDIYDYPHYYDIAHSTGNAADIKFLGGIFEKYGCGTLFEPACGTARLFPGLLKRGFSLMGCDINQGMVDYANKRIRRYSTVSHCFPEDMAKVRMDSTFSGAFCLLSTFRLLSGPKASAHLRCMRELIAENGIYVLGLHLHHPDADYSGKYSWTAKRGGYVIRSLETTSAISPSTRQEIGEVKHTVDYRGKKTVLRTVHNFRTYTLPQFKRMLKGWEIIETYDFNYQPIEVGPQSEDVVFVLKRTAIA